jgi:RND family efflux transporter MFP subunit
MKKYIWITTIIIVIAGTFLLLRGTVGKKGRERIEEELPPLEVKGTIVDKGDIVEWVESLGKVKSSKKKEFISPKNTYIEKVFIKEGQKVRKGTPLLKLNCKAEIARFEEAQYELEKAKKKYEFASKEENSQPSLLKVTTGLSKAEKEFAEAKRIFDLMDIKAPFDGTVANLKSSGGSGANTGDTILTIFSEKNLYIEASIPQVEMEDIKKGAQAIINSVSGERSISGKVISVSPTISKEKTGNINISLSGEWMLGEVVEVEIEKNKYKDRLRVPKESVLHREGRFLVFKVERGLAKWKWIEKGQEGRNYIEILDGVSLNDTVLVEGQFNIAHDAPVTIKFQ